MIRIVLTILCFLFYSYPPLCADNMETKIKTDYAEKSVWEIFGSGYFSTHFYQNNREYEIDLTPGIAYFIVNRLHIGIKNMLIYTISSSDISGKWHHFYDYAGFLSLGYVFKVKQSLYLDCMADYGITFSQSDERRYYNLISALKYDLNPALLVINITYK
jgi:hypothetical protein